MVSTKTHEAGLSAARKSTYPSASSTAAKAMISEAPSNTPSNGRKLFDRYSKKLSSQANLPRGPPARAAALTSSAVCGFLSAISGRFMISP